VQFSGRQQFSSATVFSVNDEALQALQLCRGKSASQTTLGMMGLMSELTGTQ
jgi:hypothetical protein